MQPRNSGGAPLCSQAVERLAAGTVLVQLGALACLPQAQLDGFKTRALRAEATAQRHLYAIEWCALDVAEATSSVVLQSLFSLCTHS